jgi:hypothetical protein
MSRLGPEERLPDHVSIRPNYTVTTIRGTTAGPPVKQPIDDAPLVGVKWLRLSFSAPCPEGSDDRSPTEGEWTSRRE